MYGCYITGKKWCEHHYKDIGVLSRNKKIIDTIYNIKIVNLFR